MTVLFTAHYHFRKYEEEQILENLHCFLTQPPFFFLKLNKCCQQPCYIASLHWSTFHACMILYQTMSSLLVKPFLTFYVHLCVQNNLQDRNDPPQLLVDTKQTFPVLFPYTPSALSLETLHIPASLGLDFLIRVWGLHNAEMGLSSTGPDCTVTCWKTVRADRQRLSGQMRFLRISLDFKWNIFK